MEAMVSAIEEGGRELKRKIHRGLMEDAIGHFRQARLCPCACLGPLCGSAPQRYSVFGIMKLFNSYGLWTHAGGGAVPFCRALLRQACSGAQSVVCPGPHTSFPHFSWKSECGLFAFPSTANRGEVSADFSSAFVFGFARLMHSAK
jgi:hypothetical protein